MTVLWLLRRGRSFWFALIPAVAMMVTTCTNLVLMLRGFYAAIQAALAFNEEHAAAIAAGVAKAKPIAGNVTLMVADIVIMVITAYLLVAGIRELVRFLRKRSAPAE